MTTANVTIVPDERDETVLAILAADREARLRKWAQEFRAHAQRLIDARLLAAYWQSVPSVENMAVFYDDALFIADELDKALRGGAP